MGDGSACERMKRTVLAQHDLDWLPERDRGLRKLLRAMSFGVGILGALGAIVEPALVFSIGAVPALMWTADRLAAALFKRRYERARRGLAQLSSQKDGDLCRVRGRIQASTLTPDLVGVAAGVYRRTMLQIGHVGVIEEEAIEFSLIDEDRERINVDVHDARFMTDMPQMRETGDYDRFLSRDLPTSARNILLFLRDAPRSTYAVYFFAGETMLEPGDEVDAIGYKSRTIDPSVERLERETPMRTILRGGHDLPIIITRVTETRVPEGARAQPSSALRAAVSPVKAAPKPSPAARTTRPTTCVPSPMPPMNKSTSVPTGGWSSASTKTPFNDRSRVRPVMNRPERVSTNGVAI